MRMTRGSLSSAGAFVATSINVRARSYSPASTAARIAAFSAASASVREPSRTVVSAASSSRPNPALGGVSGTLDEDSIPAAPTELTYHHAQVVLFFQLDIGER